jgi:hypothetical protein
MTRLFALFVLTLGLSMGLVADAAKDAKMTDDIRLRLAGDRDVKGAALEVDVVDGAVTIRGKVATEKQKERAEKVVKKMKGVKTSRTTSWSPLCKRPAYGVLTSSTNWRPACTARASFMMAP